MTTPQPRRTRRRVAAPAAALPRPVAGGDAATQAQRASATRRGVSTLHHREHHITKDYSHVKRDLATVVVVGAVVVGFILGMSFVIQ